MKREVSEPAAFSLSSPIDSRWTARRTRPITQSPNHPLSPSLTHSHPLSPSQAYRTHTFARHRIAVYISCRRVTIDPSIGRLFVISTPATDTNFGHHAPRNEDIYRFTSKIMVLTHAPHDVLMTPVKTKADVHSTYELQSPVTSPKAARTSCPQTPNHPIVGNDRSRCMSSPLRHVGRTSPCSVKLVPGCLSRIEGGHVTDFRTNFGLHQYQSPVSSPRREIGGGMYPRELSFANLLEGNMPADGLLSYGGTDEGSGEKDGTFSASPRKRPRKHAPVRASADSD